MKCVKHQLELYSKVPVHICGPGYGGISLIDMSYVLNIKAMYFSKMLAIIYPPALV